MEAARVVMEPLGNRTLLIIGRDDVARHMSYDACIPLIRDAMVTLSRRQAQVVLREVIDLGDGKAFGIMPGVMEGTGFGAKLVGVNPANFYRGMQSHVGVIVLFERDSGQPLCTVHAGEVTTVRTAAASAVATDMLARPDASRLAILGYGEQACAHVLAISRVRRLTKVFIWGRSFERAQLVAERLAAKIPASFAACATVRDAVSGADIICTTTVARDPILMGEWVAAGTHINAVGSSEARAAEIDVALVARARFFADHRAGVLRQGGEYLRALAAGVVDDRHVLGEIGEVIDRTIEGRRSTRDVTVYKSLGSVVQDLASARYLYECAQRQGFGTHVPF